jgi:3-oxocholest-4-en-26-oyl-CoA dehydrogenase beta subunit
MEFSFPFTEEQEILRRSARDFLGKECTTKLVRKTEEDEKGYDPELWRKMAQLGWFGLIFPEKYGGSGCTFEDLEVLLEEFGKAPLPGPFIPTVVLGGLAILQAGTEAQKQEFLSKIVNGEMILTLAWIETSASYEARDITLKAVRKNKDYILTGTKLFVPYAHVADYLLCVARTGDAGPEEDGITLFLIDAKSPGINYTLLPTIGSDFQQEINFDRVKVPSNMLLGELDKGWKLLSKISEYGIVAQCAFMLGAANRILDMSADYAKQRVQFGRPIGSFQAIQHKCVNMLIDLLAAKVSTYEATANLSKGLPATLEVSSAKAWVIEACKRISAEGHQIHAGVGLFPEHDLQLYTRRIKGMEPFFGDADFHLEKVARQFGL